jgi:murein DD-endopeptidase MepM/ murein hydrolase activator NlpD
VQPGAHRKSRGRHRKPALRVERGRGLALTAALVAGVGVAGASAAAASPSSNPAHVQSRAASQTPLDAAPSVATEDPSATAADADLDTSPIPASTLSFAKAARKVRPVPVITAQWVNPLPEAAVTSCFGQRWGRLHAGVDLAAPDGTRIRAAGAGVIVAAGPAEGYGNAVLIDHGNGYLTHYGHMSLVEVTVGQQVAVGQEIGKEGSTGHSTGPHLHFEVHQGFYKNPIEPTQWMHDQGVDIPGCVAFTTAK